MLLNCLPVRRPDAEVLAPADIFEHHIALLAPPSLGRRRSIVAVIVGAVLGTAVEQPGDDSVHLLEGF